MSFVLYGAVTQPRHVRTVWSRLLETDLILLFLGLWCRPREPLHCIAPLGGVYTAVNLDGLVCLNNSAFRLSGPDGNADKPCGPQAGSLGPALRLSIPPRACVRVGRLHLCALRGEEVGWGWGGSSRPARASSASGRRGGGPGHSVKAGYALGAFPGHPVSTAWIPVIFKWLQGLWSLFPPLGGETSLFSAFRCPCGSAQVRGQESCRFDPCSCGLH